MDVDGNQFIEYGMGLRAVTLGHAYEPVTAAAARELANGCNFVRPSPLELECAEELLALIKGAEMVKFPRTARMSPVPRFVWPARTLGEITSVSALTILSFPSMTGS